MQHDPRLRALARAIYDIVYPTDDWRPVGFEVAEQHRTIHYRQAVEAAAIVAAPPAHADQHQLVLL